MRLAVVITLALTAHGCAHHGVVDDGTSVSFGGSNGGVLKNPAELPVAGEGYVVPKTWSERGLRYGTDEVVSLVIHAARTVSQTIDGSVLGVADLSRRRGGRSAWHRSHQTGRDFDLLFYAVDARGNPVEPKEMVRFNVDGTVRGCEDPAASDRFDIARNWLLVKALASNPIAEVQWIFIADWLKQSLLDHAVATGEPDHIILKASYLMHQPGDSLAHDDHMHVRVYCDAADRSIGCSDRGSFRWLKRDVKYAVSYSTLALLKPVSNFFEQRPVQALLALSALPFPGFVAR